jgi:hypothetical protein
LKSADVNVPFFIANDLSNDCLIHRYMPLPMPMPTVALPGVHLMLATCFFWMLSGPRSWLTTSASIASPLNFLRKPTL